MVEAPVHRVWWDLRIIGCCPRHRLRLNDRCDCGATVGWIGTTKVSECVCQKKLADTLRRPLADGEGLAEAYILFRLTGEAVGSAAPIIPVAGV